MQQPAGLPPPPVHPPPHAPHAWRPYNPWAIVSISFAVSTVLGTWCLGGLIAVITGHVARHQINRTGEAGSNLALAGLIVGYVAGGAYMLLTAWVTQKMPFTAEQMGLMFDALTAPCETFQT